jgi:hypothetical protein
MTCHPEALLAEGPPGIRRPDCSVLVFQRKSLRKSPERAIKFEVSWEVLRPKEGLRMTERATNLNSGHLNRFVFRASVDGSGLPRHVIHQQILSQRVWSGEVSLAAAHLCDFLHKLD